VGVADNRDEALSLAEAERPDAALIDMNLRDGMTGPAICRALTEGGVRAAFVTGNSEHVPADRAGAVAVVNKPFTDAGIVAVLRLLDPA
jgi:CheY-like chemotaxis protein